MAASHWRRDEIQAAKAELDRRLIELADTASKLTAQLTAILSQPVASRRRVGPALAKRVERHVFDLRIALGTLGAERSFVADLLILLTPGIRDSDRGYVAAQHIADRYVECWSHFDPAARAALKKMAHARGVSSRDLLREIVAAAVRVMADAAERPQRVRERLKGAKDPAGELAGVRSARGYGPAAEFSRWVLNAVRMVAEQRLPEMAEERTAENRDAGHETRDGAKVIPIRRGFRADLSGSRDVRKHRQLEPTRLVEQALETNVSRVEALARLQNELSAEDRDLAQRAAHGRLSSADRLRLRELRTRPSKPIS